VTLSLADRSFALAGMRRKPASLLMYLVTRPSFAANREQVFDELWPEYDPSSASNSLNQSLYFLRRELDPWYEDEITVDYVAVQGDLVWLEPTLIRADSASFQEMAQQASRSEPSVAEAVDRLLAYSGSFAPEFEYEEWAMAWRSRVHSAFLDLASRTIDRAVGTGDLAGARDIAAHVLDLDPDNFDFERRLVWLYWHLGARSAASALHQHLSVSDTTEGLEPQALEEIVSSPKPT